MARRRWRNGICAVVLTGGLALPAQAGDFDAVFQHYRDDDHAAALEGFRRLSEAGDAEATYWLGNMYFWGRGAGAGGAERDLEEAHRIWHPIAEGGDARAQWRLGWMYRWGSGVEQDRAEAARWYRRAADSGHTASMNDLGEMYLAGRGVDQDTDAAKALFLAATEAGHRAAPHNLGRIFWTERHGLRDDTRAVHLFRISAERGYGPAMRDLGHAHWQGRGGVERDLMEALRLIVLSEDAGGGDSTRTLMRILEEMTPEERAEADRLYEDWIAGE